MSSEAVASPHQWDGVNGWAPQQIIAIEGLRRYGYKTDARRIALNWVTMIAEIHSTTGLMFERMDVDRVTPPVRDESKYPVQTGFLWTNASYAWVLTRVLGVDLISLGR